MLRVVDKAAEAVAVLAFAISSGFIFLNVLNRYLVLGLFRDWAKEYESLRPAYFAVRDAIGGIVVTADEAPGLLLVWVAFLGAYGAMRKDGHIAFDLLVDALLPKRARRVVQAVTTALVAGFLVVLFWQSIRMIRVAGATEIETAEIAQGWFMAIIPIAAALLLVAALTRFIAEKRAP